MLKQNMHVCTVCATERSASRHHMLKHNGRMILPMSTGCINYMNKSWTLNTGHNHHTNMRANALDTTSHNHTMNKHGPIKDIG